MTTHLPLLSAGRPADVTGPPPRPDRPGTLRRLLSRYRRSRTVRRFLRNRAGVISIVVLLLITFVAIFHSVLEPYDPYEQDLANASAGPSAAHPLGTDSLGRDVLSRLIAGTSGTMWGALLGTVIGLTGVPLGLAGGYLRGPVNAVLSRVADGLLSIPPLLFAFGIIGFLGSGETNAALAVGIVLAPRFFRIAQTAAMTVADEPYMEAARAAGCGNLRLLMRHVIPNASGPLLVQTSQAFGMVISVQAGLGLLGLGPAPPAASWGGMLSEAFNNADAIFPLLPPSIAIVIAILCAFALGDAVRDAFGRQESGHR